MRPRIPIATGLVLGAALLVAGTVSAQEESYHHGRIRFTEPGVTLQRATEVAAEEAVPNLPFLPGDRVWTDGSGRAEFQFPDGSVVRLDRASKLDYAGHEETSSEERVVLRLWSGSLVLRVRTRSATRLEVETPSGVVQVLEPGLVRVDVNGGETELSVYDGEAAFDDGQGRVRLAAGERTFARWGERVQEPERFDGAIGDDFAEWDAQREADEQRAAASSPYLPPELEPYAGELQTNGAWRYEASAGYVWTPYVAAGWQPYSNGQWAWTPYGWTWVPYEPWGWAPSHYGNWGFSVSLGWYWSPGRTWGPAWVSWGIGGGYVSWCPLGRHGRPVTPWPGYDRGHAVPRGGHGDPRGWSVIRQADLGRRDVARHRLSPRGVGSDAIRIADGARLRPTRDGRSLRAVDGSPRAIRRRPSPGDFVRELAVDNKTTIPSPWLRRSGSATARVGGADRESRRPTASARGTDGREATRSGSSTPGVSRRSSSGRSPSPWTGSVFAPSERRQDAGRAERAQPRSGSVQSRSSSSRPQASESRSGGSRNRTEAGSANRAPSRNESRPRADRSGSTWRPSRSGESRSSTGVSRQSSPRSSSSSASRARPSGGGSQARSSGNRSSGSSSSRSSSSRSSSGSRGHGSAKPRHNN
jgi:hypothetical protein